MHNRKSDTVKTSEDIIPESPSGLVQKKAHLNQLLVVVV